MAARKPGVVGRANLGFYEAAYGAGMSPAERHRAYRSLRAIEIGCLVVGVLAPIIVWLITRQASPTEFAAVFAALTNAMLLWMFEGNRQDLRDLDQDAQDSTELLV